VSQGGSILLSAIVPQHLNSEEKKGRLLQQFHNFASFHTRHMIKDEKQVRTLFKNFKYLSIGRLSTPGECVNPTDSFQIVAGLAG
jgi:hypothetical protein